jgi:hypothetical protein
MAKLSDNIINILAAAGVKLTEEQTAILAELPKEEVSATVQTFFDTVTNQASGELAKITQKAGNLDKFDEAIAGWADILGDDIKTAAKEKGLQKLDKIKTMIASTIEKAKTAAAKGDDADVVKLREKITDLEKQAAKIVEDKDQEISNVKSEYQNQIFSTKMLTKLQGRADIVDHHKNEDSLSMLVLPKVLSYVKGKGLEIRPEQLDVVSADTKTPYLKGGKNASLDDIIEEAITELKFRKNAGDPAPKGVVSVDNNGDTTPKMTIQSALRPEPRES